MAKFLHILLYPFWGVDLIDQEEIDSFIDEQLQKHIL
jgi:hypothetical protein